MRLSFPTYVDHIASESARMAEVLADIDPTTRVPTCPDWDASDLLWHLAECQLFWAEIVAGRLSGPDDFVAPPHPASYAEVLGGFDQATRHLVDELRKVRPTDYAWSWSRDQSAGFTMRRQAHEALIHRLDAEQTAGVHPLPVPVDFAADGVAEILEVMHAGLPEWASFTPDGREALVTLTDADEQIALVLGRVTGTDASGTRYDEDGLAVAAALDGEPAVTVRGQAADVDAWMWHRGPESDVEIGGEAADAFRTILAEPVT